MKKEIEFKEVHAKLKLDIKATKKILAIFFLLAVGLKFFAGTAIPGGVFVLLIVWLALYGAFGRLLVRPRRVQGLYNFYFFYNILDLFFITVAVHYLGGVEWIAPIFYIISLNLAGLILPPKRTFWLCLLGLIFYSALVWLEYGGFVPHHPLYVLTPGLYRSLPFVATQVLVIAAVFYFVAETVGSFSESLKEKIRQLEKEKIKTFEAFQKVKEAEKVLEIRVRARTRELEDLVKNREKVIGVGTKELRKRLNELEKFQKLVVGRELKMVELKKKIKELTNNK